MVSGLYSACILFQIVVNACAIYFKYHNVALFKFKKKQIKGQNPDLLLEWHAKIKCILVVVYYQIVRLIKDDNVSL